MGIGTLRRHYRTTGPLTAAPMSEVATLTAQLAAERARVEALEAELAKRPAAVAREVHNAVAMELAAVKTDLEEARTSSAPPPVVPTAEPSAKADETPSPPRGGRRGPK